MWRFVDDQLVDMIARKAMRLSAKSRLAFPDGRINAYVTADAACAVRQA
jgi:hypothetical protein